MIRAAVKLVAIVGALVIPVAVFAGTGGSKVVVNKRSKILEGFPCSQCHDEISARPVKRPPREPHADVKVVHMDTGYECYQCHDKGEMNLLVLQDGTTVTIDESQLLCGQCHGLVKRDWDQGIHGKQVGSWSGTKHRYTCADCHNPHKPKRDKMKARPAPPRPKYGIDKGH